MKDNSNEEDLPKSFLKKLVNNERGVVSLCKTCHCTPICTVFQSALSTYEKFGVTKAIVECPHYVSVDDVAAIDAKNSGERPPDGQK